MSDGEFPIKKLLTQKESCKQAIQLVSEQLQSRLLPADKCLQVLFRQNHKYGSRDRRVIGESVFSYFRWLGVLRKAFRFSAFDIDDEILFAVFAAEGKFFPVCELWMPEKQFLSFVAENNTPWGRVAAIANCSQTLLGSHDNVPVWMLDEVEPSLSKTWLETLVIRPDTWLRVWDAKDTAFLVDALRKAGADCEAVPDYPNAIRLSTRNFQLQTIPESLQSKFTVQDLSSQGIIEAVSPRTGETWWDVCAGAGGKTLQLATKGSQDIQIIATDKRENVLNDLQKRMRYAKLKNIQISNPETAKKRQYDGVIVDAPCSSSGRWRRNPEMKWVMKRKNLELLNQTQKELLEQAASCVKINGILIYGTCSVFHSENEGIIDSFQKNHPDFELVPFPSPMPPHAMTNGTCHITAMLQHADFTFTSMFRRKS